MAERTVPTVRELRVALRRTRRAHSDKSLGELLTDVYLLVFLTALYGGAGAYSLRRHLSEPRPGPSGTEGIRAWLLLAVLLTLAAVAWRFLRMVGPLVTTPAVQAWIISTPIDRRAWLVTPLWWLSVGAALTGAGTAAVAAWAGLTPHVGWAALAGAGLGVVLASLAVTEQARHRVGPDRRWVLRDAVLLLCVLLVGAAVANVSVRVAVVLPDIPPVILAAIAVVGAGLALRYAHGQLGHIDRTTLSGGAQLAGAAMSAAVMLDPSLISGVLADRRWRRFRRVHSRHFARGGPSWVLIQADVIRQWRRRADLFVWAALILVPYAVAVFAPAAVGSARIVAAFLAVDRLAGGLRLVCRTPALRRMLGGTDASLRLAHLAVPAFGLVLWWLCTLPAGGAPGTEVLTLIFLAGLLGAVYRTATRKAMSYDSGGASVADSPLGPIPTNLIRQSVRGPDLVAVLVLIGLFTSRVGR